MTSRIKIFQDYIGTFLHHALHIREVLGTLIFMITGAGFAFSMAENISWGNAIYFAFITAFSVGYGDITPQTDHERLFVVIAMLIGVSAFAYAVGAMSSLVQSLDHASQMLDTKIVQVNEYMESRHFEKSLRIRVRESDQQTLIRKFE